MHFKKDSTDVVVAFDNYECARGLAVSASSRQRSWVMESGCTYHMCSVKKFFENLELKEGGVVLLGNNKSCKVQGMGSSRSKMFDDKEILLQEMMYVL